LVIKPSDLSHQAVLKFSCIEEFKPPGPDSNYINWKFVVGIHFSATKVSFVLNPTATHLRPETWSQDNTAVCSVIMQTVDSLNYHHICDFKDDAAGMWAALKAAHKDSSSGGQMYWLQHCRH
jgi:hypothetical protein